MKTPTPSQILFFCSMILLIFLQILITVMHLQYDYFLIIEYRLIEISRFWYFQDKDTFFFFAVIKILFFFLHYGNDNAIFI